MRGQLWDILTFLVAKSNSIKRLCPSVGRSVGRSVGHAFLKYCGNRVLRTTQQVNSSKFK